MKLLICAVHAFLLTGNVMAAQLYEGFSSRSKLDSGTAIWNQHLGKVHPSLRVMNYKAGFVTPVDLDVGDGSDGAFTRDRYAEFSQGGNITNNIIRLDTAAHSSLQVTSFELEVGWKIVPVGTNPLIIRSLGDVTIAGEIHCQGQDGLPATVGGPGSGGAGRCGGQAGGDGGAIGQSGQHGTDASGAVTGGRAGNFTGGAGVGGGGGGGWNPSGGVADNGENATAGGGFAGSSSSDPEFTVIAGGAGGGGGSGTPAKNGGGGGGGGGVVIIHAVGSVTLESTGFILANGGNGGDADESPGGGGGGGSVQVFSGGTIYLHNQDISGTSQALPGFGGLTTGPGQIAMGAMGRSWFTSIARVTTGVSSFQPSAEAPIINGNHVQYSTVAQDVTSLAYDLSSTFRSLQSLDISPQSPDFLLEFSGSNDNFNLDDTGWTTTLSTIQQKRFIKFRVTITTPPGSATSPTLVDTISIGADIGEANEFDFRTAGCGRVSSSTTPPWGVSALFATVLIFLLALKVQAQKRRPS